MSIRRATSRPVSATNSSMAAARSASPAARAKSSISEAPGYEALRMTRLQERYDSEVKPALMQEFGYKNALQVPRLAVVALLKTGHSQGFISRGLTYR